MRLLVLAIALVVGHAAQAQSYTPAERAACENDVLKVCTAEQIALAMIGDRKGIYTCLKRHRRDLSLACDRVLKSHGY